MKHLFALLSSLSLLLISCENLATSILFVGDPTESAPEKLAVVDGEGQEARFGAIRQMEVDLAGNLYVYDHGSEIKNANDEALFQYRWASVRRVSPSGKVETLIGRGVSRDIYGTGYPGMAIRQNQLYLSSIGCLLKTDLSLEKVELTTVYGDCLNAQELQNLSQQNPDALFGLSFELIQPDSNIYAARTNLVSKQESYLIITKDNIILSDKRTKLMPNDELETRYIMDSQDKFYGITIGTTSIEGSGKEIVKAEKLIPFQELVDLQHIYADQTQSPTSITLDNQNNLYVLDNGAYKRFNSRGQPQKLTNQIVSINPNKIVTQVVSPDRKTLYFATETAIYKVLLPPTTTP